MIDPTPRLRKAAHELLELASYFPVVAVVGPRQVGKTTLVKAIAEKLNKEALYLDLELDSDILRLTDAEQFLKQNADKTIIIDEVQRMPRLFALIRALVDQDRAPARFLLLGSASPDLIRDSSETLAGRIAYMELAPFGLTELDSSDASQLWIRGGFPNALFAPSDNLWQIWMENFIRTYVEKDLPLLGLPAQPVVTRRLYTMLAHTHGQELNYSQLSKSLELSVPTVKTYINFLEGAFLLRKLQPYSANVKKRLVKTPKVYLRDPGLLHYIHNLFSYEALFNHPLVGASWEGYVIEQIKALLPANTQLCYYRTADGSEIDLVFVRNEQALATAEIKYTSTPSLSRGNTIAMNDLHTEKNFIITNNSDAYMIKDRVQVCSLQAFLSEYIQEI